ncbi:MAG TPA: hypothetical protein VFY92_09925 [Hyphomicrobiaceae bacterium]|nr:hypothetical protein [Hyphomicrobiaceae bacterium]
MRWSGQGPPARRHGGRIVYHRRDVLDWSEGRRPRSPPPESAGKAPPRHLGDARPRRPGAHEPADEPPDPPVERESQRPSRALQSRGAHARRRRIGGDPPA